MIELRTLTYTSRAAPDFSDVDLARLGVQARLSNALDGITGLLLFNGTIFSQTIEGSQVALDDLWSRLLADPRHHDIAVRQQGAIDQRLFKGWDMHAMSLSGDRALAVEQVETRLLARADGRMRDAVRSTLDLCFA